MPSYFRLVFRKQIDRIRVVALCGGCEVTQTHRNGSEEIAGKIDLDTLQDVRDLHYLLGQIIREGTEKERP